MPFGFICSYRGSILPADPDFEETWPNPLRVVLYLALLGWSFLGIAIISDVFMDAIEKITSAKKRVKNRTTGRVVTVVVWNATVANLTLMALGSSAPEILLSLIEIVSDDMFVGDLGVGTIIGSAAFNLHIISAVCVCALPDGEVRRIKELSVYGITATTSVCAYLWLFFILAVWTPNRCTIVEAVITFALFPILVFVAFLADKGFFRFNRKVAPVPRTRRSSALRMLGTAATDKDLAEVMQEIRNEHGDALSDDMVFKILQVQYGGTHSRAHYRHVARNGGRSNTTEAKLARVVPSSETTVTPVTDTEDVKDMDARIVEVGFRSAQYAFLESCGKAKLIVERSGHLNVSTVVRYTTRDGTADKGTDYVHVEGEVIFEDGESEKEILIDVIDDDQHEENEHFFVDLSEPKAYYQEGRMPTKGIVARLAVATATVIIVDDDDPGVLRFETETMGLEDKQEDQQVDVVVERVNGGSGTIGCSYYTESASAVEGYDFEEAKGFIEFPPTVMQLTIPITVKARTRYGSNYSFRVYLTEPTGGAAFDAATDGGSEQCILTITIRAGLGRGNTFTDNILGGINWGQVEQGNNHWKSQFIDALFLSADDDEGPPTKWDFLMHVVSVPWKLMFALVPPVDYCGGWPSFFGALLMIAGVTAVVGDVGNLVGCTLGIEPEITSITFVALGTSLPDTFASMTAAAMDPYADASIGNVVGSNSVNVFLGLGMPWTLASVYWAVVGRNDEWVRRMASFDRGGYGHIAAELRSTLRPDEAAFVVPAGSLWFNCAVFSVTALVAVAVFAWRRKRFGGELGGTRLACRVTALIFVLMWSIYVIASSIWVTVQAQSRE